MPWERPVVLAQAHILGVRTQLPGQPDAASSVFGGGDSPETWFLEYLSQLLRVGGI